MDKLPEDVWLLITSFMDNRSKRWLRLANTKWFNIIRYDDFKLYFTCTENIRAITDRLSKYSWSIKISFIKSKIERHEPNALAHELINNLPKLVNMIEISSTDFMGYEFEKITHDQWMQLSTLTNLKTWSVKSKNLMPSELWHKFEKLTEFKLDDDNDDENKPNIKQMTDLQVFDYFGSSTTWPFAMVSNPEKLTKLVMSADLKFEDGYEVLPHLTNLKELSFSDYNEDDNSTILDLSYLTALEKCNIQGNLPRSFETNTNLTSLTVKCQLSPSDAVKFSNSNLKKLRYFKLEISQEQPVEIDFSFLSTLQQLEHFDIFKSGAIIADIIPKPLFQNLSPNLKHLRVFQIEVQFSNLTHLTNLEVLDLDTPLLRDIEIISQLSKLKRLNLSCQDGELHWIVIEKLTNLEILTMKANIFDNEEYNQIIEENLPNLSSLVGLKRLAWTLDVFPKRILDQLTLLTNLIELSIMPDRNPYLLENLHFLRELTNLVGLSMVVKVPENGSLWQNISTLTKLEFLDAYTIDNNEELLSLTSLNNLTHLMVCHANTEFNGLYLTALTSLQTASFSAAESQLIHERNSLNAAMPYLYSFNYNWKGDYPELYDDGEDFE